MKVLRKSSTSTIEKEVLSSGTFSKKPTERSKCRIKLDEINYSASSIGDKSMSEVLRSEYLEPSSSKEKTIFVGDASSEVDECVESIIRTMFKGEESLARIKFENNKESGIFIELKIALIDLDLFKPIWEWSAKEKYDVALSYKEVGVALYKSTRVVDAFRKFSRACKILITMEPVQDLEMEDTLRKDIGNLRKVLYNNMAECHLIRKNYEHVISLCDKVLERDESNVKAVYRRALAHENLKDYENALKYMERAVGLEPANSAAKERLVFYKKKVHEANKNYDNIVKKMFHLRE